MPGLGDIAEFLGCELREGSRDIQITGVNALASAGSSELGFFTNPRYKQDALVSKAGAILVDEKAAALLSGRCLLVSKNPYADYARVTQKWFYEERLPQKGVHATAVIAEDAKIDESARVGAFVVVEPGAKIGKNVSLGAFSYIGADCVVEDDSLFYPRVTLLDRVQVGKRVIIFSGSVLGSDGFGFAPDPPHGYVKVPQRGRVIVEDDVEIQANCSIDRGAIGDTVIRKGAKLDNAVHLAHNVEVGENTVLAGQVGISGSTTVGQWATFAGQAAAAGHLHIGDQAIVTGQAGAGKDVPPKAIVSGSPAQPMMEHHRGLAELNRIPQLKKRIKDLEARLEALEKRED